MKKYLIFCLLFFITLFKMYSNIVIPFFYTYDGHIYVEVQDLNSKYYFLFDTASDRNVFYKKGFEKRNGKDNVIVNALFEYVKSLNPDVSDEKIMEYTENYIHSNPVNFTLNDFSVGEYDLPPCVIEYDYKARINLDDNIFDGVINPTFFGCKKNITLDYLNSQIIVDGDLLDTEAIPMKKMNVTDIYYIDIKINRIKQPAIIDTGSMFLILRPDYKSSKYYDEDKILNMSEEQIDSMFFLDDKAKKVNIIISSFSENLTGHFFTLDKYKIRMGKESKSVLAMYNVLGYEVFKNHIIQMDFENMEFRIK